MVKLIVLYPQPANVEQFEQDYTEHLHLLHEKTGIPNDLKPYKVTKMLDTSLGLPPFYQMFSMPFDSVEELLESMASEGMKMVAAHAQKYLRAECPY